MQVWGVLVTAKQGVCPAQRAHLGLPEAEAYALGPHVGVLVVHRVRHHRHVRREGAHVVRMRVCAPAEN